MKPIMRCLCLILIMLVTGVFWGTWFTLTRSISAFSAAEFIHIGKVIIANVAGPMRILMPLTLLLMIVCVWQEYREEGKVFYSFAAALLCMLVTLLITLLVEVPIDNQIKTWTVQTLPQDWEAMRHKWAVYHGLRTISSITSFVFFSLGIVFLNQLKSSAKRRMFS